MLVIKKLHKDSFASLGDAAAQILPAAEIEAVLADKAVGFVMIIDGKPVGGLTMSTEKEGTSPAYLSVRSLSVLPEIRRHGLGRMLMCMAAGEAVERQVWFLGCDPRLDETAQAFADAVHFRAGCVPGVLLLDLSDVEGLRHG